MMPIACCPHFLGLSIAFFGHPQIMPCLIAGKALRSTPDAVLVTRALKQRGCSLPATRPESHHAPTSSASPVDCPHADLSGESFLNAPENFEGANRLTSPYGRRHERSVSQSNSRLRETLEDLPRLRRTQTPDSPAFERRRRLHGERWRWRYEHNGRAEVRSKLCSRSKPNRFRELRCQQNVEGWEPIISTNSPCE